MRFYVYILAKLVKVLSVVNGVIFLEPRPKFVGTQKYILKSYEGVTR